MREIKFRAWDKEERIMINHNKLFRLDTSNEIPFLPLLEKFTYHKVMQYTGLKDKNGREIYEGDILKGVDFRLRAEYVSQVKWHEKGYWYAFNKDGKGIGFVNNIELLEVIGNIYENPELLEGDSN